MKCYFCQSTIKKHITNSLAGSCFNCMIKNNLDSVITEYHENGKINYASIIFDESFVIWIKVPSWLPDEFEQDFHSKKGHRYQVDLDFEENNTTITDVTNGPTSRLDYPFQWAPSQSDVIKIDGFPITPKNIRRMLPICILFS